MDRAATPTISSFHRTIALARLALRVLADIVPASLDVARRLLGPESAIRPRFVEIPLALNDVRAMVMLAIAVTLTPGTLSAELEPQRRRLLVHALHCDDPDALVALIRSRYESLLVEAFA